MTPLTLVSLRKGKKNKKIFLNDKKVLLDSGSSHSMCSTRCARGKSTWSEKSNTFSTGGGNLKTTHEAKVTFSLSEFSNSKIIEWTFSLADRDDLGYDMIIGRDLLGQLGIIIDYKNNLIDWEGTKIPMRDYERLRKLNLSSKDLNVIIQNTTEPIVTQRATERLVKILDSNYRKANLLEIVAGANHLNKKQKINLLALLTKYEDLFDGTLGEWKTPPVEFELKEGEVPHSQRHYPVPHLYKETFHKELLRLVKIGVLEPIQESEWGSPTFIIPKKDLKVRFISDFRRLNAKIKRKPYPLPRIGDILHNLEGFQYATSLDLNMGYYHIRLSDKSSDMCTIVTEFGKFRYLRLPMGVSCSPDIFQAKIYELLGDIEGTKAYIDDILVIKKGNYDEHLVQLDEVFRRCQRANIKINAGKCRFGLKEIDYLGYIITPTGIKPNPKKIKAIQEMNRPTTTTEVRRFIGMVQYYRDLWPRRSHLLTPFTEISSGPKGKKISWNDELEQAFNDTKAMICKETLLIYPDWNKPFDIHTDASDYQLGAVISQEGKPIAFFSRKLNNAQKNYTTTEKELLSIVECIKEFRNILFGYQIIVYSDHKNLVHAATVSQSQRVMRWRMILEEFGPDIRHISGEDNIVADAISRIPTTAIDQNRKSTEFEDQENGKFLTKSSEFLVLQNEERFPLDIPLVQKEQTKELNKNNSKIKQLLKTQSSGFYKDKSLYDTELILHEKRIYVPKSLRSKVIEWYHHYLNHPGAERLNKTLQQVCYFKGITSACQKHCYRCKQCQMYKKRKGKYGKIPTKILGEQEPWSTVHIDLIGPYSITAKKRLPDGTIVDNEYKLTCMTFLDPVTGWFEIAEVPQYLVKDINTEEFRESIDKSSARISQLFNNVWLSRYPRPSKVIFDNGSEFKKDFVPLLKEFSIKPKLTTIKNPTANSPVERIHQVVTNMLKTKELCSQILDPIDPWGEMLASVAWAIRASFNTSQQATPAQLVFGRDMIFNLKSLINWKTMALKRQQKVDIANKRGNAKRIDFDYKVGQKAYVVITDIHHRKLHGPKKGPYLITEVYTNGNVRIQRGAVNERINIRRLEPHFE